MTVVLIALLCIVWVPVAWLLFVAEREVARRRAVLTDDPRWDFLRGG